MWSLSEINKFYTGGDLDGLKLTINNLMESQKRGKQVERADLEMKNCGT